LRSCRRNSRFTQSCFAHAVQEQTGICDVYQDWFPLSCVTPFSKLASALRGELTTHLSSHPHCSLGTYLFVSPDKKAVPVGSAPAATAAEAADAGSGFATIPPRRGT